MACIVEMHFRLRDVPPEGLGARWQEERVVFTPDCPMIEIQLDLFLDYQKKQREALSQVQAYFRKWHPPLLVG
jgi:hypothetical protein